MGALLSRLAPMLSRGGAAAEGGMGGRMQGVISRAQMGSYMNNQQSQSSPSSSSGGIPSGDTHGLTVYRW